MLKTYELLEAQITREFYNANLYRSMAISFDLCGLEGFAKEYYQHSVEETGHGMKILHYLADRGYSLKLATVDGPPSFIGKCVLDMAKATYDAEIGTTKHLTAIAEQAASERDHMSYSFIQWFLDEQVEEENFASKLVGQLTVNEAVATIVLNSEYLEDEG